jgi:membrane carboxypeptidase/penicillin-binding protein PbpC
LERIEQELRLMNINMAEANDIATLAAFPTMPADLDNDSRKALQQLRKKVMKRARTSADI